MDEDVAPGGKVRDVELLPVEERRVAVDVADRRPLEDAVRVGQARSAVADEARRAGTADARRRTPPAVDEAEAALAVADDEPEVHRATQLVAHEGLEVPVEVRRVELVVEPSDVADDPGGSAPPLDHLVRDHRPTCTTGAANHERAETAVLRRGREAEAEAPARLDDAELRRRALVEVREALVRSRHERTTRLRPVRVGKTVGPLDRLPRPTVCSDHPDGRATSRGASERDAAAARRPVGA